MPDLTTTVRTAVTEALRTPGTDLTDAIVSSIVASQCRDIGADLLDLLTDAEEYFDNLADYEDADYGMSVPNRELRLKARCADLLNRLGVPQIKPRIADADMRAADRADLLGDR